MKINLNNVTVGERKRPIDAPRAAELADSIKQLGLLNPINVTPEFHLVAGLHRLEACRSLGWESIDVQVLELDAMRLELAEIDENLVRCELSTLARGEHLARRKELYEALHPETRKGAAQVAAMHRKLGRGDGGGDEGGGDVSEMISVTSFADDTARRTGRTPRTIEQEVQIAKLDDATKAAVRGTPLENSKTDLLKLVREPDPKARLAAVEAVTSGAAKSVRGVLAKSDPRPRLPSQSAPVEQDGLSDLKRALNDWRVPVVNDGTKAVFDGAPIQRIRDLKEALEEYYDARSAVPPIVDPEFAACLPPLKECELNGLRHLIEKYGIDNPLKVWKETGILLDGHARLQIATELDVPYETHELSFESREDALAWINRNQCLQRSITEEQAQELDAKLAKMRTERQAPESA